MIKRFVHYYQHDFQHLLITYLPLITTTYSYLSEIIRFFYLAGDYQRTVCFSRQISVA